jgi:integrase
MRKPRLKLYRGIWCVVWTEGGRTKRRSLSTDDEDEARRRFETDKRKPVGNTCADIFAAYLADRKQRIRHHARLGECWKNLAPECGHLLPEHIGRLWCRAYTEKRRALGRADGTIRKELSVLSAALHWQNKRTPAVIEMPPQPPPRDRYLNRDECGRLIEAAAGSPHIQLFIVLALTTGGRKEAILQLIWERVDFERGIIALGDGRRRAKGRATVPIHPLALTPLQEARRAARTQFVIEWADRPLKSIRTGFDHACKLAGLDISPHVLRHTAAVMMAEGGVPMTEIAAVLGHTNPRITFTTYAKYSPGYLQDAVSKIGWTVRGGS